MVARHLHIGRNIYILADQLTFTHFRDRLVDLVVKASALEAEDPEFEFPLTTGFYRLESYQ